MSSERRRKPSRVVVRAPIVCPYGTLRLRRKRLEQSIRRSLLLFPFLRKPRRLHLKPDHIECRRELRNDDVASSRPVRDELWKSEHLLRFDGLCACARTRVYVPDSDSSHRSNPLDGFIDAARTDQLNLIGRRCGSVPNRSASARGIQIVRKSATSIGSRSRMSGVGVSFPQAPRSSIAAVDADIRE